MDAMYLTMHAFSIDKDNSQYKGPFNSVLNFARVFTPDDTAFAIRRIPSSDWTSEQSQWSSRFQRWRRIAISFFN